jgi:hypothetical protein
MRLPIQTSPVVTPRDNVYNSKDFRLDVIQIFIPHTPHRDTHMPPCGNIFDTAAETLPR